MAESSKRPKGGAPAIVSFAPKRAWNELLPVFRVGLPMADLRLQRRMEQLDGDREALEHIARALEGRVLPLPSASEPPEQNIQVAEFALDPQGIKLLLEAMPAAIALLAHGRLVHANSAFAYAFGYRSLAELIEAGGLEAILPQGMAALRSETGAERSEPVDALTRSRRRLKVAFASSMLDGEAEPHAAPPHRPEGPR